MKNLRILFKMYKIKFIFHPKRDTLYQIPSINPRMHPQSGKQTMNEWIKNYSSTKFRACKYYIHIEYNPIGWKFHWQNRIETHRFHFRLDSNYEWISETGNKRHLLSLLGGNVNIMSFEMTIQIKPSKIIIKEVVNLRLLSNK